MLITFWDKISSIQVLRDLYAPAYGEGKGRSSTELDISLLVAVTLYEQGSCGWIIVSSW